jgi:hypothetical protein
VGFRMRESFKVAPGVRVSVSKVRHRRIGRYARRSLLGALVRSSYDKRWHSRHRYGLDVYQPQPTSIRQP